MYYKINIRCYVLYDDGLSVLSARISDTNYLYYIRGCMGSLGAVIGWCWAGWGLDVKKGLYLCKGF